MHPRIAAALLCTATLTACNGGYFGVGSGDGGSGGGGSASNAQGLWTGNTSASSNTYAMLVTPDNVVWAMSYDSAFVQSLFKGTGTTTGSNFTGTGTTYATGATGTVTSTTVTGTVTSASSFDGTLANNVAFVSTFNSQYNTAVSMADYAGTWTGRDSNGSSVTFTIQDNGSYSARAVVSGKTGGDCTITGSFTINSFGKSYTNTSATFGGINSCVDRLAGQSLTQGVGVRLVGSDSTQQPLLLVQTANTGQTLAWYAYARKQVATP